MCKKNFLILLSLCFSLICCKGVDSNLSDTSEGEKNVFIYITGACADSCGVSIPGYWVNNEWHSLQVPDDSNGATASCICVNNNDIYVGGDITLNTKDNYGITQSEAAFWKNGVLNVLPFSDADKQDFVSSIFVNATGVYAGGGGDTYNSGGGLLSKSGYWLNSVWNEYGSDGNIGYFIIEGDDLYMTDDEGYAGYLKNNIKTTLQVPNEDTHDVVSFSGSIEFDDSDIYVTGGYFDYYDDTNYSGYWKNGVWNELPVTENNDVRGAESCSSLCVKNNTVYACGCFERTGKYVIDGPCCWVDGTFKILPLPDTGNTGCHTYADSIGVIDDTVYITGTITTKDGITIGGYWKNGVWNELPRLYASQGSCTGNLIIIEKAE